MGEFPLFHLLPPSILVWGSLRYAYPLDLAPSEFSRLLFYFLQGRLGWIDVFIQLCARENIGVAFGGY